MQLPIQVPATQAGWTIWDSMKMRAILNTVMTVRNLKRRDSMDAFS